MSQVYSTEPATTGRVLLQTSHGPIDIHLWCKECPITTKAFLQLCLDGYYDHMIFHRILNDFLIQCGSIRQNDNQDGSAGGDDEEEGEDMKTYITKASPSSSSTVSGLASTKKRKLEISPRIKFNHRGQIALALPLDSITSNSTASGNDEFGSTATAPTSDDDLLQSKELASLARQFFITLDEAPFLNTKHVIFGTVTGATIFNAIRIGKTDTKDGGGDGGDDVGDGQPSDMENAPVIKSVKIDFHPFGDDLVLTNEQFVPWKNKKNDGGDGTSRGKKTKSNRKNDVESDLKKRRKKRKGKKDLNVLSFGGEMEEEEGEENFGMHSSHEVVSSADKKKKHKKQKMTVREEPSPKHEKKDGSQDGHSSQENDSKNVNGSRSIKSGGKRDKQNDEPNQSSPPVASIDRGDKNKEKRSSNKHKKQIATQSSTQSSTQPPPPPPKNTTEKVKPISAVEARRLKYLSKRKEEPKGSKKRDDVTMSKLLSFKSKIFEVKSSHSAPGIIRDKKSPPSSSSSQHQQQDDSLASRMTKRSELEKKSKEMMKQENDATPTYTGQILEQDDEKDSYLDNTSWLKTKFKCKRHVDHASKEDNMASTGGDGRNMEDYDVIDDQKKKKSGGSSSRHLHHGKSNHYRRRQDHNRR